MLWWSAAGMLVATAGSGWQFGLIMLLMGMGEAACWPTAVKAIHECFGSKERAIAMGYFDAGSPVGAILTPIIVTPLARFFDWRVAFVGVWAYRILLAASLVGHLPYFSTESGSHSARSRRNQSHPSFRACCRRAGVRGCSGALPRGFHMVLLYFIGCQII
jgi:MFS family permease